MGHKSPKAETRWAPTYAAQAASSLVPILSLHGRTQIPEGLLENEVGILGYFMCFFISIIAAIDTQ